MKTFVAALTQVRNRADKGYSGVSQRSLSQIKRETVNNQGLTSRELLKHIKKTTLYVKTRCRPLKKIGTTVRPVRTPISTKINVQMKWTENNMKVDFSKILFTDESHTTFYGPDPWCKGGVVNGQGRHQRRRRQKRLDGFLIELSGIMVGPWKVPDCIKCRCSYSSSKKAAST